MRLKFVLLLSLVFFALGLITLPHYGINWDTINHLPRGQAYLHYFLTGKKDYSDLPEFFEGWQKERQWYWQKPQSLLIDADIPKSEVPRRSMYQLDAFDFDYFVEHDGGGHPPLSDILSSVFNLILFQKLRLINDIDSYRVYGVLLAAALVGLIYWWAGKAYGPVAGLIAALSLSLHPLFWAELHFNTEKDVPETVYWGFLLFSVWKGVSDKSIRWLLLSGVFFGLALGTKFNVLFIPFVILPWLVVVLGYNYLQERFQVTKAIRENINIVIAALVALLIGISIFLGSWPYLWPDIIGRLKTVVDFYKEIGLTQSPDPRFLGPFGTNTLALQWIIYTTPLVILVLAAIGVPVALKRAIYERDKVSLLFLLWLLVPIARVTWPGTNIYGGVRQIMEYIPAMALLAGLGGMWVFDVLRRRAPKLVAGAAVLVLFIPIIVKLIQIHPNENVYFNPLIGGLSGAKEKNFPFWGLSFGAPYRQGTVWLNDNAEEGANVVYVFELIPNIPRIWLRQDLNLHNSNRSGHLLRGEYAITLVSQGTSERSYYDMFLERFIEPVYEVKVDGVAILKIWKNDGEHLRTPWQEKLVGDVALKETERGLLFDLGESYPLARLEVNYEEGDCSELLFGYVQISGDGKTWDRLPGNLPEDWRISVLGQQPKDGSFLEPFVGQRARYIELVLFPENTCLRNVRSFKVYRLF